MLYLTDVVLPVVLLTTGIFLTVKLKFVQVRYLFQGIRNMFSGKDSNKDRISPFASLMASLAAQLGTGNIVGAGSAIIAGGPGAVFWMWVSAFFGMATAYSEASLSIITRKADGTGGTAYYITEAFGNKGGRIPALAFSLFSTVALGFTGVAVQSNSISEALSEAFGIPGFITGIGITVLAAVYIFRGTRAVARFSEKAIPAFAVLYTLSCLGVIIFNIKQLPAAIRLIFTCAFSPKALFGGITGIGIKEAVSQGIKRGLFTNEAGMGSSPSAHILSSTEDPHFQGTLGIAGVFIDTFLMLSVTALAVITVLYTGNTPPDPAITGSEAVTMAIGSIFGERGAAVFIALSVLFFAFASILGWNMYGRNSSEYIFGKKSDGIYMLSSLFFIFLGCIMPVKTVWLLTDIFNTLMVLTNVPALIKLSGKIRKNLTIYQSLPPIPGAAGVSHTIKEEIPSLNKISVEKQKKGW